MAATNFDAPEPQLSSSPDEQPMFGNPTLTRGNSHRRGGKGWLIGIPLAIAAIAVAGVAYFATNRNAPSDMTSTEVSAATPPETGAPPVGPVVNPAPPAAVAQTTPPAVTPPARTAPTRIAPTRHAAATPRRTVRRATSAAESSADVSASVPAASPPVVLAPSPPPSTTTQP